MPRPEKVQAVEEIRERLENSEATFLTEYRGLSVGEQQELRRGLREAGADYKVVKMSLARRAAEELGLDEFSESMVGPTALAFAGSDPIPVAKALKEFAKAHENLVLKVGLMSGKLLAPEQVSKLAEIEPREVLLAKIAGAAKAPLSKMAGALSSFLRDSASMFSQLLEKKESGEFVPAGEVAAPAAAASEDDQPAETESEEQAAPEEGVENAAVEESAGEPVESPETEPAAEPNAEDEPAADAEAEEDSEEDADSEDAADSESDEAADEAEEE